MPASPLLKVGISASLSGQFQVQGRQALAGLQAWAVDVNQAGGIALGNTGARAQISVIHHDDSSKPDLAKQTTRQLISQDKVDLLFGPYSGVLARAAAEVAESSQRVIWNQGGATDDIYQQGYRWVVGVLTPASQYLTGLLPLIRDADPDASSLGLLRAATGAFPRVIAQEVQRQADALGFRVSYLREYPASLDDFSGIVEEIREAGPDVLVAVGRINNDLAFAQALVQRPLPLRAVAVVAAPIQQFLDALGDDVDGFIGPSQWEPGGNYPHDYGPSAQQVLESLAKQRQGPVDYPMAQAYAAGLVAQRCLEHGGSLDDRALRQAAAELDFSTFYGRFKIDPVTGRQVGRSTLLVQWQQGRKVILWPPEQRQAPLVYPWPGWDKSQTRSADS